MKNSEALETEIGYLGSVVWNDQNKNRIRCEVSLKDSLAGVSKFVFVFLRSKSKVYHFPITKKDSLDVKNKTVLVIVVVSQFEPSFSRTCMRSVQKRIENQLVGHNTEMNAFALFSTVHGLFPSFIDRPRLPNLPFKRYDIIVPVKSMRSFRGEEIPVPVQVKTSKFEQVKHIERFPKVPSIVVPTQQWEHLIEPAKDLLFAYVNEAKVLHVH